MLPWQDEKADTHPLLEPSLSFAHSTKGTKWLEKQFLQ